ncbi:MAG: M3 family oligoendopeptidase [Haloarculaceae archaeon]
MSLPERDAVDPEYRFDLTQIYQTPEDWAQARDDLDAHLDGLTDRAEEPLDSRDDLRALLEAVETAFRRKQRLALYATLAKNVATDDDAAADRMREFRDIDSRVETAVGAVRRRLRDTDDDRLDAFVEDLDDYERYARNLREQARYVRSAAVESVVAAHDDARTAPTRILTAVTSEDFDPPDVERPDGESVALRYGNFRRELSHGDREYRRRVYEAYREEMDRYEATLTRAYAEKLAAASTEADVRGYDSVRDRDLRQGAYPESGLQSNLPEAVHDVVLDTVRENLGPYHRSQDLRRDCLGVDELGPWDREVSLADAAPEIDYETAKSHVLDALAPLGDGYVERARSLFAERRIDVFPTESKRTDIPAYCPSSAADGPYILANFRGDVRTTFFLCHELGHAVHVEHHREGPVRYATCPRPVEEVPSILHEILLAEHLVEAGGELADAAHDRLLEFLGGNFYRSTMGAAFAHELAGRVESGEEVTEERARETWRDLQREFEPRVVFDDRAGRNWLGRGAREPYSSYQYVLGATGALAVRDLLRTDELAVADYREFLRSTGERDGVESFAALGCDVTTPEPFERAAATFGTYVSAAESALG